MSGIQTLIVSVGGLALFVFIVTTLGDRYSLNSLKDKTVGHGQHGTARWATSKEIRKTYRHIPFAPEQWRTDPDSRPKEQGIVVGCKNNRLAAVENFIGRKLRKNYVGKSTRTAMVDTGDVHALMIGAAGVGKTAYWLYPCLRACSISLCV